MKKYNIPVSWIQQGLVTMEGKDLKDAADKVDCLDVAPLNLVGQTAPGSTRIAYSILKNYVPDEHLSDEVKLYTSSKIPDCPFCDRARQWFKDNNIKFKEVDIMLDEGAKDRMFKRTNVMNMPQVEIGNEIQVGFTEPEVKSLCIKYGLIEAPTPPAPPIPANGPPSPAVPPVKETVTEAKDPKVVKLHPEKEEENV